VWQTPPALVELLVAFNDDRPIGLDPCTSRANPTGALRIHTPQDCGLAAKWGAEGLTYVNPPFSDAEAWVGKCISEWEVGNADEIILLTPPGTETVRFATIRESAHALAFWHGWNGQACDRYPCVVPEEKPPKALCRSRLSFVDPMTLAEVKGNTTASMLAYWGRRPERFRRYFSPFAWVVAP
jgi:hypothetical protein